jgi:hypothetical protein
MKRFVEGDDRKQVALLPECVDDYIDADNRVGFTLRPLRPVRYGIDRCDAARLPSDLPQPNGGTQWTRCAEIDDPMSRPLAPGNPTTKSLDCNTGGTTTTR